MRFELEGSEQKLKQQANIKVVGVGGGGCNAIANMMEAGIEGVDFIVINTDHQALDINPAPTKILIGTNTTKGLGAGGTPEVGRKAALEDVTKIEEALRGADMVFVAAGMGGGTGTGAAPVVAAAAKDVNALTVSVVTRPFRFEGRKRARFADEGVLNLQEEVDAQIIIPNERLLLLEDKLSVSEAFAMADTVLCNAVRGISDLITAHGTLNVDFADVKTIMGNRGRALMGTGYGQGDNRAVEAAQAAINNPLLEDIKVDGATGILINVTGGSDMTINEVSEAVAMIEEAAHEDVLVIFGCVNLTEPCEEVKVTVIATGFQDPVSQPTHFRSTAGAVARDSHSGNRISTPSQVQAPLTSRASMTSPVSAGRDSTEQVQISSGRTTVSRTSMVPERDLDIPTFLRRQSE